MKTVDNQSDLISGNPFLETNVRIGAVAMAAFVSAHELQFLLSVHRLIVMCNCTGEGVNDGVCVCVCV